jgi:hypothetical protein
MLGPQLIETFSIREELISVRFAIVFNEIFLFNSVQFVIYGSIGPSAQYIGTLYVRYEQVNTFCLKLQLLKRDTVQ